MTRMIRSASESKQAAFGGTIAGVAAGLLLTAMMTAMSFAAGKDVWYGIKGAAAPLLGERAMSPGFDAAAVALGLFAHLTISAVWGVAFALLFYGASRIATLAAGVFWGFVVWLVMYELVLPLVGLAKMTHDAPTGRAIMFHLFFSIPLAAIFLAFQRPHGGDVFTASRRAAPT